MTSETSHTAPPAGNDPRRWPKHAVWLGVVITFAGFMSYYFYFAQFPDLRDFPVINLPLVLMGMVATAAGCWGVFRQGGSLLVKSLAGLGLLLTVGIAGFFNVYIFSMSYQLPVSSAAPATESAAPEFALLDHESQSVSLSDFRGQKVLLVFYRGYW